MLALSLATLCIFAAGQLKGVARDFTWPFCCVGALGYGGALALHFGQMQMQRQM